MQVTSAKDLELRRPTAQASLLGLGFLYPCRLWGVSGNRVIVFSVLSLVLFLDLRSIGCHQLRRP